MRPISQCCTESDVICRRSRLAVTLTKRNLRFGLSCLVSHVCGCVCVCVWRPVWVSIQSVNGRQQHRSQQQVRAMCPLLNCLSVRKEHDDDAAGT